MRLRQTEVSPGTRLPHIPGEEALIFQVTSAVSESHPQAYQHPHFTGILSRHLIFSIEHTFHYVEEYIVC